MKSTITLTTLPTASSQEVFDHVSKHLLTQKVPSKTDIYEKCVYHHKDGLQCAAGCLISDEEYSTLEDIEGHDWSDLVVMGQVPPHHQSLISDLQLIRDWFEPSSWVQRLHQVAERYQLRGPQ